MKKSASCWCSLPITQAAGSCPAAERNLPIARARQRHDGQEYWTLPGRGIQPKETPEQAVVREVAEEVGLDALTADDPRQPGNSSPQASVPVNQNVNHDRFGRPRIAETP